MSLKTLLKMKRIKIDIANTPALREQGLMFKKEIPDNYGMLFVMDKSHKLNFWGANTYVPLDIAFINDDKKITSIKKITPLSYSAVSSDGNCKYALETPINFFENNKIQVGNYVDFNDSELTFIVEEGK